MAYVRRNWVDYPDTSTPIDADALNNIEDGIEESHNIQLLAVIDTAPSECAEGDKYYDTTTKLIYTATGTDEWGETGETPIYDILYIVLDEQTSYTYNGTTLVSVGGGSSTAGGETLPVGSEIDYDGSTVPTGWEEIGYDTGWIEATVESGFTTGALGSSGNLMYRRIGKIVFIKGSCKGFTAGAQACTTLPHGFRPPTRIDFSAGRGGSYFAMAMVSASGSISVLKDTQGFSADYWYAFCTSYITDEDFPSS